MKKKRRTYTPRVVGGQVMLQADLERLHKYMLGKQPLLTTPQHA